MNIGDLQKGMQAMFCLSHEPTRPNGEEHEPFTLCVNPILEQMNALQTLSEHHTAVLFSLTTRKARKHKTAAKVDLSSATIDSLLHSIKGFVFYDKDIQDHPVSNGLM